MPTRLWTPEIVRPPSPVVDGALRRIRREERDRWSHIRDPRVERQIGYHAAVDLDAAGTNAYTASVATTDYTGLTVGSGSNRALWIQLFFTNAVTSVTVTWDQGGTNQTCSFIGSKKEDTWTKWTYLYGLVAPTSGNKTLRVSWTTVCDVVVNASSFTGVDQTGGTTTFPGFASGSNTSTTPAVTVVSAANNMAVAACQQDAGSFSGRSHTSIFENGSHGVGAQRTLTTASGASVAFTWTISSSQWGACGNDIVAVGGGGGGSALKRNSSLNGLGASGPFFHDPLSAPDRGMHARAA